MSTPRASPYKHEAVPLAIPAPGILHLVVDPIDRTSDAEEKEAIRVGSHLYLIGVREGDKLLVHLCREAATSAEGELARPAPLARHGSSQKVVEVVNGVLIGEGEGRPLTDDATDRNVSSGAGIDAEQVVLVIHPAEILLHRQEGLTCHGRDRKVGILEQLPEKRWIRAAEPEPAVSARTLDRRVAQAPKPVAQLEGLRSGKRDGGQSPGAQAAVGYDRVEGLCGKVILELLLGDGLKPGVLGSLRPINEASSLC